MSTLYSSYLTPQPGTDDDDDDDESVQSKISRYSLEKVMQIALITGKTPDEVAAHLLRKENEKKMEKKIEKRRRTKKLFADALEVGKNPKEIAMFLMQEEKKRTTQEQATEVKKTPKETVELLVQAAEKGKAQEQVEQKEQEKMEELEERTVEKKGGAVAAQVSNMAAYLFKKDQERKLEKLKIGQEVTAALKAGKSPVEIAKFLTKVEEERLKVEEERRAKKANEYLVTRALKKGKTPGEIAAILLKNKEAQNQPDQELKREALNRTPKDAAVAGGKSCKVEPHVDVAGVENHSSEEKDNEDAASDACVLTEKQVKIELEIQKLKADLGKAELVQKEIEKLKEKGGAVSAQVSKIAAYLFKKDQERKLEKLKIEQEVTAALKAGKSPVEIAKFLTRVEEERLKVEEERRAKKANEYLVTRALKKGKTPGEIAAILLKNKEAQNQPDQELKRETLNRTPKDAAVAGGKPCNVEPHVDVVGVDNHSSEEKDNEDAASASDANVLTEKQVKIELEIHKLKADLGKAELVQKEIEKLKADLFRAELKIKSLEEENHDDDEDTSFNDSELGDDLEYDQLAGFFRCFPIRVLAQCV